MNEAKPEPTYPPQRNIPRPIPNSDFLPLPARESAVAIHNERYVLGYWACGEDMQE
jgi:hypothetical protein